MNNNDKILILTLVFCVLCFVFIFTTNEPCQGTNIHAPNAEHVVAHIESQDVKESKDECVDCQIRRRAKRNSMIMPTYSPHINPLNGRLNMGFHSDIMHHIESSF